MKYLAPLLLILSFVLGLQRVVMDNPDAAMADTTYANPDTVSELALLMREMQAYTVQAKLDVKAGNSAAVYPPSFFNLNSANTTPGVEKSEYYKSFADLYIKSVKGYVSSAPEKKVETYNTMVSACLACHSQHCPGPIKAIRKLIIE